MLGCANDLQKKDLEITKGTLHGNDRLGRVKCPWPAVCSRKLFACVCSAILLAESSEASLLFRSSRPTDGQGKWRGRISLNGKEMPRSSLCKTCIFVGSLSEARAEVNVRLRKSKKQRISFPFPRWRPLRGRGERFYFQYSTLNTGKAEIKSPQSVLKADLSCELEHEADKI